VFPDAKCLRYRMIFSTSRWRAVPQTAVQRLPSYPCSVWGGVKIAASAIQTPNRVGAVSCLHFSRLLKLRTALP
jgi:hypothetical protein